jgi:glycosyltransferase 2 family protein
MMAAHSHARRTLLTAVKIALAVAILSWLAFQARDGFARRSGQPTEWPLIAAALGCTFATAMLSFVRWHMLIRALGIDVRLIDSLRLGALGLALNYVSPGSIGGDFFKAVFLAHGQPGRRTEAVATVVADRVIGLLTMLVLASTGILATGLLDAPSAPLKLLCRSILVTSAVFWIGFALLLLPRSRFGDWLIDRAERLPVIGATIARLMGTIDVYRSRKSILLASFGVSLVMALCFVTSFYLVACGILVNRPTWPQHLVIVPMAGLAGAIPLTPSGLGTMEAMVEWLYRIMPVGVEIAKDDGTMVAFTRRATEIVVALFGFGFYLSHRREVKEVFAEAEELEERGVVEL